MPRGVGTPDVEVDELVQSPEDEVEELIAEAGGLDSFAFVFVSVASDGRACCGDRVQCKLKVVYV